MTTKADQFRRHIAHRKAVRAPFARMWLQSGIKTRTTAELLPFAESAGFPVGGKTPKSRLISVGLWLTEIARGTIECDGAIYRITPAPLWNGYRRWTITVVKAKVEENCLLGM